MTTGPINPGDGALRDDRPPRLRPPTHSVAVDDWIYVVTDIETDGPDPGANSMLACASVATRASGEIVSEFEAVLSRLPGAAPDAGTLAWFRSQPPAVWAAATEGARPIAAVMEEFVSWVTGLGDKRVFAAAPLAFDGPWFDYYLRRFTRYRLAHWPYDSDRLFTGPALCLRSYGSAVLGVPIGEFPVASELPEEWLGNITHSHRALDDARGYAQLLCALFQESTRFPSNSNG